MAANSEVKFAHKAVARIRGGLNATATTIPLYPGGGTSLRKPIRSGDILYVTLIDAERNVEIVKVTDIGPDSLTVERAQGGTSARAWDSGTVIIQRLTAAALTAPAQKGVYRQIAYNPNGTLSANYVGEEVLQLGISECQNRWWKNTTGTYWRLIAGDICPEYNEYYDEFEYVYTPGALDYTIEYVGSQDEGSTIEGIWSDGTFIYIVGGSVGIRVYSMSGGLLTQVDTDDRGDEYTGVWGDGTFIYVTRGSGGIDSYSVDGAGQLTFEDNYNPIESYMSVWGDGTYVYTGGFGGNITSLSVDVDGAFSLNHELLVGGNGNAIWGDGTFVYGAFGSTGIHSFSVDGSGNLTELDSDDQTGTAYGVTGDGTYVYLAMGVHGTEVYTVNDSGVFTHVDRYDIGGDARGIYHTGFFILVANSTGPPGFQALYMDDNEELAVRASAAYVAPNAPYEVYSDGTYIWVCSLNGNIDIYIITFTP